jgi:hypothetical protein
MAILDEGVKKRKGRPPNFRPGILSAEQVQAIRGDTPQKVETVEQAAERRAADALRKREDRAAAKAAKEFDSTMSGIETIRDFWALSRTGLTPEKLAAFQEQQDLIAHLLVEMTASLDGKTDAHQIQETDLDVAAAIDCYGIANVTVPMLLDKFWLEEDFLNRLTSATTPSAIFAKFGFLTAVPDYSLHLWNDFAARHASKKPSIPAELYASPIQIRCVTPECESLPTSLSPEMVTAYKVRGGYRCQNCLDRLAKVKAFTQQQRREFQITDPYGRIKSQGRVE